MMKEKENFLYDFYHRGDPLPVARIWWRGCADKKTAALAARATIIKWSGEKDYFAVRRDEKTPDFTADDYARYEEKNAQEVIKSGLRWAEKKKKEIEEFIAESAAAA